MKPIGIAMATSTPSMGPMRKRQRLSLLPSNAPPGANLGAPLGPRPLINRPSMTPVHRLEHRQSLLSNNNINNINNNSSTTPTIQQLVQGSIQRTNNNGINGKHNNNNQRESSIQPLPTSAGGIFRNQQHQQQLKNQDPRPIRSHRFQSMVQDELYKFLATNKFDIEMKQQLSLKTLKTPTQKEFLLIFQWLYHKIDPGYKFSRSIDNDIYTLLKFLNYPFIDTINKSQISAVGGSNWPIFLAMLYWLLDLVKNTIKFDSIDFNNLADINNIGSNSNNNNNNNKYDDSVIEAEQSVLNKLFIEYALKSYKSFLLLGDDDYSKFYDEMNYGYKNYIDQIQHKFDYNSQLNENLQESLNIANDKYNIFFDELDRTNALKNDVIKFKNYIEIQKQRQLKWPSIIKKANSDIINIKESIKNINKEKQDIINDLQLKNLTLNDIEQLHKERAILTNSLNELDSKQSHLKNSIDLKLIDLQNSFNELQILVTTSNNLIYEILNNLNLSNPISTSNLIINSINDEFKSSKFNTKPIDILPNLSNVQKSINELKLNILSDINKFQDEILQSQELLDDLKLSIVSDKDKVEELEDKLTKSRKEYNDLNDSYTADSSAKQIEFEEMVKEIRLFKSQNIDNKKSVDQKWKDTQEEYKRIMSLISEKRSNLIFDIATSLESVVDFKSDIISEFENTLTEVNKELKQQIESADT